MAESKKPSEMSDEEFNEWLKQSELDSLKGKNGLNSADEFYSLNLINDDGKRIDEDGNIIEENDLDSSELQDDDDKPDED